MVSKAFPTSSLGTLGPRPLRLLFPLPFPLPFLDCRSGLARETGASSCLRLLALLAGAPGLAGAVDFGGLLAKGSRSKLTLGLVKTFGSSTSRGSSPVVVRFKRRQGLSKVQEGCSVSSEYLRHCCVAIPRGRIFLQVTEQICMIVVHGFVGNQADEVKAKGSSAQSLQLVQALFSLSKHDHLASP